MQYYLRWTTVGGLAGWLAGRRRVVALGSDVAEEDEDQDSDSCTWRTRAESIAVALMGVCVGNDGNKQKTSFIHAAVRVHTYIHTDTGDIR